MMSEGLLRGERRYTQLTSRRRGRKFIHEGLNGRGEGGDDGVSLVRGNPRRSSSRNSWPGDCIPEGAGERRGGGREVCLQRQCYDEGGEPVSRAALSCVQRAASWALQLQSKPTRRELRRAFPANNFGGCLPGGSRR